MDPVTFYLNIEVCRICPNTQNLTSLYLPSQQATLDTLKLIINIKEAQLPKFICGDCEIDLLNFIEFKGKCEKREKELLDTIRLMKTNHVEIKQELTPVENMTVDDSESLFEFKIEEYNVSEDNDDNSNSSIYSESPIGQIDLEDQNNPARNTPKEYPCPFCNETFLQNSKLTEHKSTHKTCPDCPKVFKTYKSMIIHRRGVHILQSTSRQFRYNCPICNIEFSLYRELVDHKKLSHKQCPDCLKEFDSYGLMIQHRESVHGTKTDVKEGLVSCHLCGKDVKYLNKHIRTHNRTKTKLQDNPGEMFSCPYPTCDKMFKIKVNINKHIRSVHLKERNYSCDVCDLSFFEVAQLRSHASTHSVYRNQTCDFPNCKKTCKTDLAMKLHKNIHLKPEDRVHHGIGKQGVSWICSYCGKVMHTKNGHDTHLLIHTNEKPHECDICHKSFRQTLSLKNHKRIHTNEKPYECKICNTSFRQQAHLITHSLTHETEKKFSCTICDMSTKFKYNLYAHMKTVHHIENFNPQAINAN